MSGPGVRVPITTWLSGPTYRAWAARARQEGTTVAVLLAYAADRAATPPRRKRSYVRVTPELATQMRAHRAEGLTVPQIAERLGCSERTVQNWLTR